MFIHLNTCVRMTDSDFDPTANHSVVCPICRNFIHHITYEIPVNTFVDLNSCSVGMYIQCMHTIILYYTIICTRTVCTRRMI